MRIYFLLLFFFLVGNQIIIASDQLVQTVDTVKINKFELPEQKVQADKPPLYNINFGPAGISINKTFGIHPLLDMSIAKLNNKNTYKLLFEGRYGHSKNEYMIRDNDTLKSTNVFSGQYLGLEFERMLFWHPYQELFGNIGFGYDWISIKKKDEIRNNHILGGIGFNIGVKYILYIRKKHGPELGVFYHFADFKNKGGSNLSNNSYGIRVSYNFGRMMINR